jgi:hypothetical protein
VAQHHESTPQLRPREGNRYVLDLPPGPSEFAERRRAELEDAGLEWQAPVKVGEPGDPGGLLAASPASNGTGSVFSDRGARGSPPAITVNMAARSATLLPIGPFVASWA